VVTAIMPYKPRAEHNGGSVRVLPGRACHSALRCRAGIKRPRLSTLYRLDQPWGAHRRLARVSMSGTADGGHVMRRNPCGSHGRPPSGPPGTEGTVLICPCAAGRRGLPRWGFNSVLWGFNSVARSSGRKLSQQREAVAALSLGGRLVMRLPQSGPGTGCRPGRCLRRFRSSRARAAQPGGTAAFPGRQDAGPAGPRLC
jgi:hypothetical protein